VTSGGSITTLPPSSSRRALELDDTSRRTNERTSERTDGRTEGKVERTNPSSLEVLDVSPHPPPGPPSRPPSLQINARAGRR
jgi:hypothetical protein